MRLLTFLSLTLFALHVISSADLASAQNSIGTLDSTTSHPTLSSSFMTASIGYGNSQGFSGLGFGLTAQIRSPLLTLVCTLNWLEEVNSPWSGRTGASMTFFSAMIAYGDYGKQGYFSVAAGPALASGEYRNEGSTTTFDYTEPGVALQVQLFGIQSNRITRAGLQLGYLYSRSASTTTVLLTYRL